MMLLQVGSRFGKYTVARLLGKGGMGEVYLVRHDVLDTYFALKVLSKDVAEQETQFVTRFLREGKLCCKIRHPNLVMVHDAGRDEDTGLYYLIMDYVPGGSLREMMNASGGRIDDARAIKIVREIASALVAAADFKLVHRDIKPENIMFGQGGEAKLADLGIAKASAESLRAANAVPGVSNTMSDEKTWWLGKTGDGVQVTMENAIFGTPAYMSPEQALDSGKVDARADLYSLGVVFFEMLTGRRPYDGLSPVNILAKLISNDPVPDVRTVRPDIPERVAGIVRDLCEKDVSKRMQSAKALLDRLEGISDLVSRHRVPKAGILLVSGAIAVVAGVGIFAINYTGGKSGEELKDTKNHVETRAEENGLQDPGQDNPTNANRKSVWKPPKKQTVIRPKPVPKPTDPEPMGDPIVAGEPVILGGKGEDATILKSRLKAAAFVVAEKTADLFNKQVLEICAQKPSRIYIKLCGVAERNKKGADVFQTDMSSLATKLRDNGVEFTFVLEKDSDSVREYNDKIEDLCGKKSYNKMALP